ncbi:MAG: gliding motility protein GldN, partial [Bacteroidales bacterium]|nr:gliding motility protein GldN [Bacteroidales bacterium]
MKKLAFLIAFTLFFACAFETANAQVVENKPPSDNFYEKVNNVGKVPRAYVPVREADVYIKKRIWRTIDFREKFNQFFYYPTQPVQDRISFMTMVMDGLKEGSISAYDAITDDFKKPLTYEEFISANTDIQEKEVEDLDNPGQMITRVDTSSFSNENAKFLRIKEDWFIDRQRGMRDTRIMGLCPTMQLFDEQTGELKGNQPMFWIRYEDCRNVFVNTEAFNRHNSALRMSYDDVFAWKRFFNSYIYKEDNQQDRSIQEYLQGWQVMAEAERIKEELLNL